MVVKVNAHQTRSSLGDSPDPVVLNRFIGNQAADAQAKVAANLHKPDECDVRSYLSTSKLVTDLARHLTSTMAKQEFHIPKVRRSIADRVVLQGDRFARPDRIRHEFIFAESSWLCIKCLRRTASPSHLSTTHPFCRSSSSISKVLSHDLGHKLWISFAQNGKFLFFCSKCWAFAQSTPRLLVFECVGAPIGEGRATTFCPISRSRILAGRHPSNMRPISKPSRIRCWD